MIPFFGHQYRIPLLGENHGELDLIASQYVESILKEFCPEENFFTLSPQLPLAISKSFCLLKEYLSHLLKQGAYLEFGLYKGFALWFAQKVGDLIIQDKIRYFGFDSFAGLPNASQDYINDSWFPGMYAASLDEVSQYLLNHKADFSNLTLIQGWYSRKLFQNWNTQCGPVKAAIVTIDCNVYESCNEVLNFFVDFMQPGTILLFDDFVIEYPSDLINRHGERRALMEFLSKSKDFALMPLFPIGWSGYAFMITECLGKTLEQNTKERILKRIGERKLPEHFPLKNF